METIKVGEKHNHWKGGIGKIGHGYLGIKNKNHPKASSNGYVSEHILVAEKALGKLLPIDAVIHHINGIRNDNRPGNLVICQDNAYHLILHRRERAYRECGHASWRKCTHCKQYDDSKNMHINKLNSDSYHQECSNKYQRDRRTIWKQGELTSLI